jgi:hypothetical protein
MTRIKLITIALKKYTRIHINTNTNTYLSPGRMGTIPLQVRHLVRATLVDGISFYHRLDTSEHDIRPMEMTNLYHGTYFTIDDVDT